MSNTPFGGKDCNWTDYKSAKIVVIPVPYDYTATWQKGADLGPEAIIEASEHVELYDIETDSEVHLHGIHTFELPHLPRSPEKLAQVIKQNFSSFTKDGKFQTLAVNAFRLTDLSFSELTDSPRMCIAFAAATGQNIVSPPVWRTLETVGRKKMDDGVNDDAVILGLNEHTFDKVDRMLAVNLNFALHASKTLIENFGYDSIEPLRLDDLMVSLKTVNLPKIDSSIKNTHAIGLKFTHAMAWLIGLGAREMTLESLSALRGMLRYLTSRGIVHKTALTKTSVFRKGMDMASVELTTPDAIKATAKKREQELLEDDTSTQMWFTRNVA